MPLVKIAASCVIACLTLATPAHLPAQGPGMDHGPIKLSVVVTPGDKGKPIAGLTQNSFTVLDNGAAQPIRSFRALSSQTDPVKILLVIDAVNTDFLHIAYERERLEKFLRANDGRLSQPTALAILTDTGTQVQPGFSTDGNALSQMLDKQVIGLRDLRRSAGFYGAEERLQLSLKTVNQLLERAATEPGRKFIVFLTPGWPLLSGPNVQFSTKEQQALFAEVVSTSNAIRRANATLYALDPLGAGEGPGRTFYFEQFVKGVSKPSQALPGDLGAQVLAVQSGGQFLGSNNDIGALLQQTYDDAKAAYEITYVPPPSERMNEYHRIQVRMAEPRMTARTLQGYYTQP